MSTEIVHTRSPLLPDRYPTPDFFVCDIFDAAPKGDLASIEPPIFSLATKPDTRLRRYEHGSVFIEIAPSAHGLATVHDRDILIYCISQLMAAVNEGKQVSQVVHFKAHDLLKATNRTNQNGQDSNRFDPSAIRPLWLAGIASVHLCISSFERRSARDSS